MGRLGPWRRLLRCGAGIGVLAVLTVGPVHAREPVAPVGQVALAQLPDEARKVHRSILAGGPFLYSKDGSVFGNRERTLPRERRGFYREYTVATPGERSRGARRIICGGVMPTAPSSCYYTGDHYASFNRITP
ncbi:MAG: ribonuclease [Pseudomonadota bacterium]|nr:ribonuclease [Pseudomonadota bacterium]